mgnify:CR=1 FL=1
MAEVTDETYAAEPATTPRLPDAPPIRRTFSPGDVLRVLSGLLLLGLGVLFATVAENTISGIESDVIGYRVYLDWRNGFDVFGKTRPALVLSDIGQDGYESYHEMADWGADILKVGKSLGMGGYGYWDGSKAVLVSDVAVRTTSIHSSGPINSSLEIDYRDWNTGTETVDLKAVLSMQAGSPLVDVELELSRPLDRLAIGVVAHPDTELLMGDLEITGEAWSYMASFGRQTLFDDHLGMAVLFRKRDFDKQARDENSYVLVMRPRGTRLSYAFGAFWSGEQGGIQTRGEL